MTRKTLHIKLLAIITVLFALAIPSAWAQTGNWDVYKATAYDSGSGTESDPYLIKTAEQLAYFAARVTNGQDMKACFKLGANIDLSDHFWVPIGKTATDDGNNFSGTFDGHGYVISGMTVKWEAASSGNKNYGFFSQLRAGAQVRNIVFDNARLYNEETSDTPNAGADRLFGVLAGMIHGNSNTEIKNIAVHNSKIEAKAPFKQNGKYYVIGGFIGKIRDNNDNCKIANIYVDVDIDFSKMTVNAPNNVFIATFISEYQANVKSSPKNLYVKGNITASAALTFVGPVYGKNKPSATTVNNTWYVESGQQYTNNSNSTALKPAFTNQATEVTKDEENFKTLMNAYVASDENLLQWTLDSKSRLHFKNHPIPTFFVRLEQSFDRLTKKAIVTLSGFEHDKNTTITWSLDDKSGTEIPDASFEKKLSLTVPLSISERSGSVIVSKTIDGETQTRTVNFTIPVRYYSTDLYADGFQSGSGTESDPYLIATDLQLAKLACDVTNGKTYNGQFFKLKEDIQLNAGYWIPIGNLANKSAINFQGTLEGDGKTISDMTIRWDVLSTSSELCYGLFSSLYTNAKVRNLVIDNADVCNSSGSEGAKVGQARTLGILAGSIKSGTSIENIIIKNSNIYFSEAIVQNDKWFGIGGLAGKILDNNDNYTLSNVYVDVNTDVSKATINKKDNIVIGTIIGEFQKDRKTWPTNVYSKGNITGVSGLTKIGPIFGTNIPTSTTVNNTWYVEDSNTYKDKEGNNLTVQRANALSVPSSTGYSTFTSLTNNYCKSHDYLYFWNSKDPAFLPFFVSVHEVYDASTHKSKEVKFYLQIDNPENYDYVWTVDGKSVLESDVKYDNKYSTISTSLRNKAVQGNVKVSWNNGTESVELSFSMSPKYYSIDLYDDVFHDKTGDGTKEKPYVIATDLQLARLAYEVNNSSTKENFVGKYFVLSEDIDLSSALWMPIGAWNNATERYFFGKFDGKGHTINNMRIEWRTDQIKWNAWGLFSRILGKSTTEAEFGCITNLIFQDAEIQKKAGYQPIGDGINIGIAAAEVYNNGELSNIIIRNSKITDNEESYTPGLGSNYRIGGVLGNVEPGVVRIFNLSSDVTINMFKNTNINSGNVNVGGGIGRINSGNQNNALNIYPANIYVHGPAIVTNGQANNKWGAVVAVTNNPTTDNRNTWYYVNGISGTGTNSNYGTPKELNKFAIEFIKANNKFSLDNAFDEKEFWVYSTADGFNFGNTTITIARGQTDVATATTPGKDGNEKYYWYLSNDQVNWEKQQDANGDIKSHTFTIPRKEYDQYVYAELVDGSSRSKNELVKAIRVTSLLDKTSAPTYTVKINTNVPEWDTLEKIKANLSVSFEWYLNSNKIADATTETYTHGSPLSQTDKLRCHLKVTTKDDGITFINRDLFTSIVVFLDPEGKHYPGTQTGIVTVLTEDDRIKDNNWGYSSDKPMSSWKGAYYKLEAKASWDENVIVLMSTSIPDSTKNFNLTSNTSGTSMLTPTEWEKTKKTNNSFFFRNTTITGKWEGTTYDAKIRVGGKDAALPIWGDTRFENLSFQSSGEEYDILYCQYNNLEMGEGVKMLGYTKNSPGYGTIGSAWTTSFQVFGGINNDGRFYPLNTKADNDALEASLPHGKEGFKMVFKSGHYSTICVGGRQSGNGNYNGIMGTANMPIKCTIEMDINRTTNDQTNDTYYNKTNDHKRDFDAGIIMAGNHEGAMYGDVDIIVKSGKVGRIVGGTLGNQRDVNATLNPPYNTYMGRVNILLDPYQSRFYTKGENTATTNGRIMVTELYGGSCGRGFEDGKNVDNPFYGTSTVTINGGTFQRLEKDYTNGDILCGIFGAGAGGMNGIGDGTSKNTTTPDTRIAYWKDGVVNYGDYNTAKGNFAKYHCYNADTHTFTDVDPEKTSTKVIINGGVFGSSLYPIDGVYGGGSGYMATGLWTKNAIPNVNGGNIYGKSGQTVASLTINGGEFYCKNGVFAGGRGTDYYYATKSYGGTYSAYTSLGKIYGNVEMNINGGTFHCPVFGGGYGVADAKLKDTQTISTLSNMALITGQSRVNINGGTFYKNVYGGGDMARIDNGTKDATMLSISDNADVRGAVFAAGNGREKSETYVAGKTLHPELVGKVTGNTNVSFYGTTTQAPYMYGDIFGGGNLAYVDGDTYVNIYAGNFAGEIFGGGNGKLNEETKTVINSADVTGNTSVMLAQDQGGQEEGEGGTLEDQFSINVIWDKLWDSTKEKFYGWAAPVTGVEEGYYDKSKFWDGKKFLNAHNIYGGGKNACVVGKYTGEPATLTNGTGTATVTVQKGMTPFSLLKTQEWKNSYTDNNNPHFYVFGGGYGKDTKVGSTKVTVNVEGDYGLYDAEITDDDDVEQLSKPVTPSLAKSVREASNSEETSKVFDNSKGIPNFTVLGVLGGGYAGTVSGNTNVTVDGMTFIHRVYGGGFGDPSSESNNTTGEVGGNTEVYVKGAKIYGDVFGGGAGVKPTSGTSAFTSIARVKGTTMVEVSDDAKVYGKVFGGGDIANVSAADGYKPDFTNKPTSVSTLNQTTGAFESYEADNYKTFVNIIGGDIFGEVFAGGKGLKKSELDDYTNVGRVDGNTLLHIANTNSGYAFDGQGNNIPYVWNRIYGGCSYGTVNGNTLVHVEGGMLGLNIFGGGYGDVPITGDQTNESMGQSTATGTLLQVLGKKDTGNEGTYANILGNTKVQIDGGSWIWNRKADINGNVTTWTAAADANNKVLKDFNEFRNIAMALTGTHEAFETEEEETLALEKAQSLLALIESDASTKEFFDFASRSFMKNHNIFGGGNRACHVSGEAIVELNHSPLTDILDDEGNPISLLDCTTLQGMCWYLSIYNTPSPQFSVFGAGYGANTKVGSTKVLAQPGTILSKDGKDILTVNGKTYQYRNQVADLEVYSAFEQDLYDYYKNNVTETEKKLHYGSIDGSGNDPNTYLRYRASRMAFSAGIPNFTFMNIHGGGFSGYVTGDTYVETDCQLACRNVFGGGLGSKPYLASGSYSTAKDAYDFGKVGGSSKVFIKSGIISNNVYGGGAGVESVNTGDDALFDFPDMARVTEGTKVHIYGEDINYSDQHIIERTSIFGSVYGGGDVANVGTTEADASEITNDNYKSTPYTSLVDIRGGVFMSQVFAGGKGRIASECKDYTQLGAIYGNAYIASDKQYASYPYRNSTGSGYTETINPSADEYFKGSSSSTAKAMVKTTGYSSASTAIGTAPAASAYIWNRIYGGCQNGTVYGNTLVAINDGNIGYNVFGGGWGDISASAKAPTDANVTGNTNVLINGGTFLLTSYWLPNTRNWVPAVEFKNQMYSPQYDPEARTFKINHNIYGGGNLACQVKGNTYITLTKGLLKKTTGVRPGDVTSAADYNFFASDEWKEVFNKVGSPHFAVFGGGYGENTNILGDTHIDANMTGYTEDPEDITLVKGEEYKHFVSEYSVMDLVGGGYSGKVTGDTYVTSNGLFCRRVFGGGFYNSVKNTNVNITVIDSQDIFGGGLMGDVENSTNVTIGTDNATTNKELYVHGSIYGGNDVSGYVNIKLDDDGFFADNNGSGTNITIRGGQIDGNVYGAGNGNYLYALDRKGNTKVTVNEHYRLNPDDPESEEFDLVYTVPMRESMPSYKSASDAAKIVNINSWRPLTNKVSINIKGNSTTDRTVIKGDVYGGGNSATVLKVYNSDKTSMVGDVTMNIGSNVSIGRVFMGCNGDELFTASEDNAFMTNFRKLNGDILGVRGDLNLSDKIDWLNDPSNKGISTLYLPTKNEERPLIYPHLLDLYFQPVEMDIQGDLLWNGTEEGTDLTNCTIGTFCCGGNRGNMNIYPQTTGNKAGNVFEYIFPEGLTITDKIVGGCNNANYEWKSGEDKVYHEGGYLLGLAKSTYPFIKLVIKNKFKPKEENGAYIGGNVYGGCFETGTIRGDITIDLQSDMLNEKDKAKLEKSNELLATNPKYAALNVYGAGYGMESYVYGNPNVMVAKGITCNAPDASATTFAATGTSANFIYGGGQQGNVIGVTNVEVFNGHIFKSVTGGSYSGYVWGSAQVKVGYPTYYTVNFGKTGKYILNRVDQANKDIDANYKAPETGDYANTTVAAETIKQSVYLVTGDIVSQAVYDDIVAIDNGTRIAITDNDKSAYFTEVPAETPSVGWDNINIKIGEALYGGGYSLAQGSSVTANNTTVLKFTETYNLDNAFTTNDEHKAELAALPNGTTAGFGGNTTILVGDSPTAVGNTDRDHITISHQEMKEAKSIADGADLHGYYYKDTNGNYKYIYMSGLYFASNGGLSSENKPAECGTDLTVYEYDNEGGIFGDGHLSYVEGFRSADLTGYGFASHTIASPKIINTFQRLDIIRLTDNCFTLLGARDYATNATDKTPYSISRVGEIQMHASNIALTEKKLYTGTNTKRARNYMGLANNIHYVGAVESNVSFDSDMYDQDGALVSDNGDNKTYRQFKQSVIEGFYKEGSSKKGNEEEFQKRNNGTAKNMIGIASGYALRIHNVQALKKDNGDIIDKTYYGPIYGVVEMNLIDVRQDEGGGYVYADNVHKKTDDFLETTGNFVFPYKATERRYIVDDCFPSPWDTGATADGKDIHYWYVTGFNYYYNAHITGYTSKSTNKSFDSLNNEITVLSGLSAGAKITIQEWKRYSANTADFDLTKEANKEKYKLYIGASAANKYDDSKGFRAQLYMHENTFNDMLKDDASTADKNESALLPDDLTGFAKISFLLKDNVDNSSSTYYKTHLSEQFKATILLTSPVLVTKDNNTTENMKYYMALQGKIYTKDGDTYTKVADGVSIDVTGTKKYYYRCGDTNFYQEISTGSFYTLTLSDSKYNLITTGTITNDGTAFAYLDRYNTYTIDLVIDYVQGPDLGGKITVENCALPGEMIRLKKSEISVDADESFSATAYYWRIGKDFADNDNWIVDGSTEHYDVYKVGDEKGKGVFSGCYYNKTEDYLEIPAYYYMNGYKVQLGVSMNGLSEIFSVPMSDNDRLVVHNFHQMDPHAAGVNLHLAEALARTKDIGDNFAAPRIYISDQKDIRAFVQFVDTIGTGMVNGVVTGLVEDGVEYVKISGEKKEVPRYGEYAQFIIQNNITLPDDYVPASTFKGIIHGNGHVISNLSAEKALVSNNEGNIYNLGLTSGAFASGGSGKLHCCFEYEPTKGAAPVVYRMNGTANNTYSRDDFRYGKVAYDLNEYYLRARYGNTSHDDLDALKYVYDYYANGDYQYANRRDDITGKTTGVTWLRTGQGSAAYPNYGNNETRHDKRHTIDHARAVGYVAEHTATAEEIAAGKQEGEVIPESFSGTYKPLFNAVCHSGQSTNTENMNDFLFWGQSIQNTPESYPSAIESRMTSEMVNRVFRTAGYYGDTSLSIFHYNAFSSGNRFMSTYVHRPTTTAIDFTCKNDKAPALDMSDGIWYAPIADNASVFKNIIVQQDVSRNLLVYTAPNDVNSTSDVHDALQNYKYDETTNEAQIKCHHITIDGSSAETQYLHLVERTPEGMDANGNECRNNNFCVPIQFTVKNRAWYVRKPMYYANAATGSWEGICLPFTASKVVASLNGEITHFYGSSNLHHEYWLRGFTSVTSDNTSATTKATFQRPGTSSELFKSGITLSYVFDNKFFVNTYGEYDYNYSVNNYYNESHTYSNYRPLTAGIPYIVRFPGEQYYEFDLSSVFYNTHLNKSEKPQTVTFNAYGTRNTSVVATEDITIPVISSMATTVSGYSHTGTFSAKEVAAKDIYGMNADGSAFDDNSTYSTVMPFRTFITSPSGKSRRNSVIYISETTDIEQIVDEERRESGEEPSAEYLRVRAIGKHTIKVESTYATNLHVFTSTGQLYRILDVCPGTATYSGFLPGIYIFGTTKLLVK